MASLVTRTAKLLPYTKRPKSSDSFATAYYYEPLPEDPNQLGTLFAVIEVLGDIRQSEEVVDLVIETLGDHYYNQTTEGEPLDALKHFEEAIKRVNQELANYTNKGNTSWIGKISAVLAVLYGDQLHLTQTGSAEAYLYRGTLTSHITENLQTKEPFRPTKSFVNVASGQLRPNDRVLITTPALLHQVAKTDLAAIIRDSSPNIAIQKISNKLHEGNTQDRVAALVIELTTAETMAFQTLPDEPDELLLGERQGLVSGTKKAAGPLAKQLFTQLKRLTWITWRLISTKVIPAIKSLLMNLSRASRRLVTNLKERRSRSSQW